MPRSDEPADVIRMEKAGRFPRPTYISPNRRVWFEIGWQNEIMAGAGAAATISAARNPEGAAAARRGALRLNYRDVLQTSKAAVGGWLRNVAEHPFKKVPTQFPKLHGQPFVFLSVVTNERRRTMRKLSYVLAALATIAVAAPTVASAQGFSVRIGSDRDYYRDHDYYGPRAGFYGYDRGWHRGWYHRYGDRDVIIRRHHYWDD
ncbi:hypothetical protein [Bradyrhizobium sp. Leo121]|uniref:hypothetical protein n=1 Tax=Bradyrhizobium sp. Leo121 TaxID=1571195 RepID=UPI0026823488